MATTRIYPSAVDKWFYPGLFLAPLVFCTLLTFLTRQSWAGGLIGSGVGVIAILAVWPFTRPCHYTLSDDLLKIKAGFLEIDVPLATIQKVERVRSFLAAPCLSINRVLITMKDGKEMVSPSDRDEFIADLSERIGKTTGANKSVQTTATIPPSSTTPPAPLSHLTLGETMKILSIIFFGFIAVLAKAEYPPRIAASDRIVTIEQWRGRGNDALVWAVRPTEITIYHIFSSTPDEVLATVQIQKEEAEAIRDAVSGIGMSERGKVWFDANVFDGSSLRISFSANGDLREDRIEVENHWRPEFQKLIELISKKAPEKWKIGFRERVAHLEQGHKADIRCVPVKEYYGGK